MFFLSHNSRCLVPQRNPFDGISRNLGLPIGRIPIDWWNFRSQPLVGGGLFCRVNERIMYRLGVHSVQAEDRFTNLLFPQFICETSDGGTTWHLVPLHTLGNFGELAALRAVVVSCRLIFYRKQDGRIEAFRENGLRTGLEFVFVPSTCTAFLLPFSDLVLPTGATAESLRSYFAEGCVPDEILANLAPIGVSAVVSAPPEHSDYEVSDDGRVYTFRFTPGVSSVLFCRRGDTERVSIQFPRGSGKSWICSPRTVIGEITITSSLISNGVYQVVFRLSRAPVKVEPTESGSFRFIF
ncbi:MAG: hypothetical protein UX09_C0001G0002 [Candidatus Uhrbacteria bacterium GW2011_GWE2_45_35]|nr:MAG: hypothetical protein UX09_C0001G0002 [Candidatus Uhrbacteria bacterium GW2011_GWE2_45_35]